MLLGLSVLALVFLSARCQLLKETPEYILPCNKSDPEINACVKRAFNHLRPYLQTGIPEIDVPPIEPMNIPRMAMENGNGAVRIRAVFSNMTAHGASNYTVLSLKTDLDDYRIDMGLEIPRIEALGKYDVSGNILLFPVRSRGEFTAIFR